MSVEEFWPFTPEVESGGWMIEKDEDVWGRFRIDGFKEPETDEGETDDIVRAEMEESADVNLIAAAPRMYRALKHLFTAIDAPWTEGLPSGGSTTPAYEELREVIRWIDAGLEGTR